MQYDQFVGQVQHRGRLSSNGEAITAIRATLETLAQRIQKGEAEDLAAQLPSEVGYYVKQADGGESFNLDEFFHRVSEKEGTGLNTAVFHARAVVSVLLEAVSQGEIDDIRSQLSDDFAPLFESGSEGDMDT